MEKAKLVPMEAFGKASGIAVFNPVVHQTLVLVLQLADEAGIDTKDINAMIAFTRFLESGIRRGEHILEHIAAQEMDITRFGFYKEAMKQEQE